MIVNTTNIQEITTLEKEVVTAKPKKAKLDTKDFKNLPLDKWNSTTIREYIKFLNVARFGIPAVTFNVRQENGMISKFIKEYGIETTKAFIEECVKSYRPNPNYPTVNFATMYSYMKAYELPRVMKAQYEANRLEQIKAKAQASIKSTVDNVENYF